MRFFAWSVIALTLNSAWAVGLDSCEDNLAPGSIKYTHDRGLISYGDHLPSMWIDDLASLGPQDHVIDMGAGLGTAALEYASASFAADLINRNSVLPTGPFGRIHSLSPFYKKEHMYRPLVAISKKTSAEKAKVSLITLESVDVARVPDADLNLIRSFAQRPLENIPADAIARAILILDVFGVMAYTKDPAATLKRDIDLLLPGGKIYLGGVGPSKLTSVGIGQIAEGITSYLDFYSVRTKTGQKITLREWIKQQALQAGMKVTEATEGLVIQKPEAFTGECRVFPPIRSVGEIVWANKTPHRRFEEFGAPPEVVKPPLGNVDVEFAKNKVATFFANYQKTGEDFVKAQSELLSPTVRVLFVNKTDRKFYDGVEGYFQSLKDWSEVFETRPNFSIEHTGAVNGEYEVKLHGDLVVKSGGKVVTLPDDKYHWIESFRFDSAGRISFLLVSIRH